MTEVVEVVFRWHRGDGITAIARALGADRKTVRKVVGWARQAGIRRDEALPPEHEVAALLAPRRAAASQPPPTPGRDRLVPVHAELEKMAKDPRISIRQMWRLHLGRHPEPYVAYNTFKGYVQSNFRQSTPEVSARLFVAPGHQAQVDFGYVGLMADSANRKQHKTWAFIMTLSYSRYRFVRFVFHQDARTWVDCHARAFEFFQAVPNTVVLDNLKAAVIKPDIYDPLLNPHYRECERHYGFAADTCKVRHPQHKGRVEAAVKTVRGQLLAGREFADIGAANAFALEWCRDEAGMMVHGTTKHKPREDFEQVERAAMLPLPAARFELANWSKASVHLDHMVVHGGAYYSVPTRYIGATLWLRATDRLVQFFLDGQLVKTHLPARPGEFRIDVADFPEGKRIFLLATAAVCRESAAAIGPATGEVMTRVLAHDTNQNRRKAQAILRLGERFGAVHLEGACRRALQHDNLRVDTLRGILEKGLACVSLEEEARSPAVAPPGFARSADYFAHALAPALGNG